MNPSKENVIKYVVPSYWNPRKKLIGSLGDQKGRRILFSIIKKEKFKSVLDVGFGTGRDYPLFKKMNMKYVGIEPIIENVMNAKKKFPEGDFRTGFAHNLEFPDKSFDLVWVWSVIETLPMVEDKISAINECLRVAKKSFFMIDAKFPPIDFEKRFHAFPMNHKLSFLRLSKDPVPEYQIFLLWRCDK